MECEDCKFCQYTVTYDGNDTYTTIQCEIEYSVNHNGYCEAYED